MANLHPRRYVFHGCASGVSAQIRRPQKRLLPVQGSSSLPVTGGLSESAVQAGQLDKWVSFDGITTSAAGDYVDAEAGVATTRGDIAFDAAPTETKVMADVRGLVILGRVHVARASVGLISRSAVAGQQPVIRLEGNRLEGVRIDDSPLKITLAEDFFQECDTHAKLAKKHSAGLAPKHARLFVPATEAGDALTVFPDAQTMVKCTIVEEIAWEGAPHPTATIHGNVVRVPNFGKIYFGELFISGEARRLTMVRFQLGSEDGGEVTAGEGETNGSTYPPNP
jgi:hypothetical protein